MRGRTRRLLLVLVVVGLLSPPRPGGGTEAGDAQHLTADPAGWALHPAIASAPDGTLYAAWAQHLRPERAEYVGIRVQQSTGASWRSLGGRIGHREGEAGAQWPEGHAPSLAVVGGVPYVAWYEAGGYGWGTQGDSAIFVAHWQSDRWVLDRDESTSSGALNTVVRRAAREPSLAAVGGLLHAAWIETVYQEGVGTHNVIAVKRLIQGRWTSAARPFRSETGRDSRIMSLALTGVAGTPFVAWSEVGLGAPGARSVAHVARLDESGWKPVGGALNASPEGHAGFVALTALGDTLYVAWQERGLAGTNQVYVRAWRGGTWMPASPSLNADALRAAGRPALTVDGSRVWLAWTEGGRGERPKLFVRSRSSGGWAPAIGPLNADLREGAADTPGLSPVAGGVALIWAEKSLPPATKQVHVRVLR